MNLQPGMPKEAIYERVLFRDVLWINGNRFLTELSAITFTPTSINLVSSKSYLFYNLSICYTFQCVELFKII